MCGITGVILKNALSYSSLREQVQTMNERIKHRGPEHEGISTFDNKGLTITENQEALCNLGLGHQRLSIIDLTDAANQPMSSAGERFWITYNGEIYNYIELRAELEKLGHTFKTQSDTEVILKGFEQWGSALYEKLEGMWAFAIFDRERKTVILSRDRTGVKPLYYIHNSKEFRFASEVKALLPYTDMALNESAFSNFILNNTFHFENETFFTQIRDLEPGTELRISIENLQLKQKKYFDAQNFYLNLTQARQDKRTLTEELYDILNKTIKMHYRSDVPIGSNLSGGLDSSLIVSLMRNLHPDIRIPVFSAVFPDAKFDESKLIEASVKQHNLSWNKVIPDAKGLLETFDDIAYTQEYPLISTSTYAQYKVMQLAHNSGIKVLINGQGADELFGGYVRYGFFQQLEQFKKLNISKGLAGPGSVNQVAKYGLKNNLNQMNSAGPFGIKNLISNDYHLLSKDLIQGHKQTAKQVADLNQYLLMDYYQGYLTGLLRAEDRNSMRFSIESRVPFANSHELAAWTFSLPAEYKYEGKTNKPLLRNLLKQKKLVTPQILQQKTKLGFTTPMNGWLYELQDDLLDYLDYIPKEYLSKKDIKTQLRSEIGKNKTNPNEQPNIFKWISLGAWFKTFGN